MRPSTVGLKETIGAAASTCSLQDVIESDLVVLWGTNPANNQPVFMKYLYLAKQRGCRVVVVNPYLEPGLERYWVPSNLESALFGTKICDLHVPVRPGGDVALANAALKRLIERGALDDAFIAAHTTGLGRSRRRPRRSRPSDELLEAAGITADQLEAFVDLYAGAASAVLVWSMGITQHRDAVDGVRAIVNLGLARGNVGRDGAGLMPIRGHSGVQGGAEMGAYATAFPGGVPVDPEHAAGPRRRSGASRCPTRPGRTAPEMVGAAAAGELDVLWTSGGNFLEVLPDPPSVAAALDRVPLRVHQDVVVTTQMLADGDDVVLLPVATRYEQEGGGTADHHGAADHLQPGDPAPGRGGPQRVAPVRRRGVARAPGARRRVPLGRPTRTCGRRSRGSCPPTPASRRSATTGDQVQWGGRHLCAGGDFPLPDGRGRFTPLTPPPHDLPDGAFTVATRRGKQFNSMVHAAVDPLTGAGRDAVYIDEADARALGADDGAPVRLRSEAGTFDGHLKVVRLPARSLQVHWPEGNVLISGGDGARASRARRSPTTTRWSPSRCWRPTAVGSLGPCPNRSRPPWAGVSSTSSARSGPLADGDAVAAAVKSAEADGVQVVSAAMLGHKADVALMALGPDLWRLRQLQTEVTAAGLEVVDSYVSLTELSEYAQGVPDELKEARLHPQLPPGGQAGVLLLPDVEAPGRREQLVHACPTTIARS